MQEQPVDKFEAALTLEEKKESKIDLRKPEEISLEEWQTKEIKSIDDFGLRHKQKLFLEAYLQKGGSGKKAWMQIYETKNEATARTNASEELTKPNVKAALQWLLREVCSKESVVAKYEELREASSKDIQLKANDALAKMHALFIDKQIEKTVETVHFYIPGREVINLEAHNSANLSQE